MTAPLTDDASADRRGVTREGFTDNPAFRAEARESLAPVRALCEDLGLVRGPYRRLWRSLCLVER
jgi:hypothetical protein